MKKLFLLMLLVSSVSHAEKMMFIEKYSTGYSNQMFLDIDSIHSGKIKGINRLNTNPTGQYVIMKYEVDCNTKKIYFPKGPSVTYDQHGRVVTTDNFNVPIWSVDPSDNTLFAFLYNKYCKKHK